MLEVDKAVDEGAAVAPPQASQQCAPAGVVSVAPLAPGAPCRPQQLLALVCKAVRASLGGVGVLGADGKLREHWTVGMPGDLEAKLRCSDGGAALAHFILEHAAPLRLANFDPIRQELALPDELGELGPFLGIPLVYHGRPVGAFYLARPRGEAAFSPEDDQIVLPVREWLAQHAVPFETLRDPDGNVAEQLGMTRMPTSFLIDAQGRVRARHDGFQEEDEPALAREVRSLLAAP